MMWLDELAFWLTQRGSVCKIVNHHTYYTSHTEYHEYGVLVVDDVEYRFRVTSILYRNAEVTFEGVPGVCECPDQQMSIVLYNGSRVSERYPGLRWCHGNVLIDADKMCRLWKARKAYPWEMPCVDAEGRKVTCQDIGTCDVDTTSVLDFIYPHVLKVKLNQMRMHNMAKHVQRVWREVSLNPYTPVGWRRLQYDYFAIVMPINLGIQ